MRVAIVARPFATFATTGYATHWPLATSMIVSGHNYVGCESLVDLLRLIARQQYNLISCPDLIYEITHNHIFDNSHFPSCWATSMSTSATRSQHTMYAVGIYPFSSPFLFVLIRTNHSVATAESHTNQLGARPESRLVGHLGLGVLVVCGLENYYITLQ
jgi:hypothetical protein